MNREDDWPSLVVNEIFGPTVQGEGPTMGRRCAFLRLGGCNLRCSWCDTPYTWDWRGRNGVRFNPGAELHPMLPVDVAIRVCAVGADMLVVSGGEPMSQQRGLAGLWRFLPSGMRVEVETNGTVVPVRATWKRVDTFNVSPKLAHSGDPESRRYKPEAIDALQATGKAVWKFVAAHPADLDEIALLVERHNLDPIYVMPLGKTRADVHDRLTRIADDTIRRGWNLTTRLHVDLWGERRAV